MVPLHSGYMQYE